MLCWRDSHCEQHTLVGMLRRDLQSIQGYTDMLLRFFFFGKLHWTHKEMDHKDQISRLVLDELEMESYRFFRSGGKVSKRLDYFSQLYQKENASPPP